MLFVESARGWGVFFFFFMEMKMELELELELELVEEKKKTKHSGNDIRSLDMRLLPELRH